MSEVASFEWLTQELARGLILLLAAWGLSLLVRRGAARYGIWRATFGLLAVVALLGFAPKLRTLDLWAATTQIVPLQVELEETPAITVDGDVVPAVVMASRTPVRSDLLPKIILSVWLTGVGLGAARFLFSWYRASHALRDAERVHLPDGEVYESRVIESPVTFGIFRPRILVPVGFSEWPARDLEMILQHERAHVRNLDGFWQALATVVAILHWPNPLVWFARRRLAQDREMHADTTVILSGASPRSYTDLLLRLAGPSPAWPQALPMARKSSVPMRIEEVLQLSKSGKVAMGPLIWASIGLLTGVGLTLGLTSFGGERDQSAATESNFEEDELLSMIFQVPLTFADGGQLVDSYVSEWGEPEMAPTPVRQILEEAGITFPEGASAAFNRAEGHLIVRNTQSQLDLVEAYVKSLQPKTEKLVYLTSRCVIARETEVDLSHLPLDVEGVFTDPQFQVIFRELVSQLGDSGTAVSLVAQSGQRAVIHEDGEQIVDITPVIGQDGFTLEITMHESLMGNARTGFTIWDGQTIGLKEPLPDGQTRMIFVTAHIMDAAGDAADSKDKE